MSDAIERLRADIARMAYEDDLQPHHDSNAATVKQPDIFGGVFDHCATEAELNGYRAEQAPLFDVGPEIVKVDPRQAGF